MVRLHGAVLLLLAALTVATTVDKTPSGFFPTHYSPVTLRTRGLDTKAQILWERYSRSQNPKPKKDVEYRLDGSVVPILYDLTITPYLDNEGDKSFTYEGNVIMVVEVAADTTTVTFHSYLLEIDNATISVQRNGADVAVVSAGPTDQGNEFYVVTLAETVTVSDYLKVSVNFRGLLLDDMEGFYRSSYKDGDTTKWLAVTNLKTVNARKAFPCFDEPQLKAIWNVNIRVPAGFHAEANMPLLVIANDGEREVYRFTSTPEMSSYLVCFIVSQFESTSASTDGNHKLWSRPSASAQRSYAAELSPRIIRAMEEWTKINFTLPKIDQLALPDHLAGATENWGIVTYRESYILSDAESTPTDFKQFVVTSIAHEYSHQWFGNLVTLPWWNVAWLNEGFATYFETYLADLVAPEMRFPDQFVRDTLQSALERDGNYDLSPMTSGPNTTLHPRGEISTAVNIISTAKSGSVLRMFDNFLGREVFQGGLQIYLDQLKFASGSEDVMFSIWDTLISPDQLGGFTVTEIAKSWTNTPGYPVLRVRRDASTNTATVTQKRFLLEKNITEEPAWIVPVNWAVQGDNFADTKATAWLNRSDTLTIQGIPSDSWIILNKQVTGFYRVDYDAENWALIVNQLNTDFSVIDIKNQAQLIDDAFTLALTGLGYTTLLELTVFLQNQQEYVPWITAYDKLSFLNTRLYNTTYYDAFKAYVQKITGPLFERFGTFDANPSDSHVDRLLQNRILTLSCLVGNPTCSERANALFRDLMAGAEVPADVRSVVYCEALKAGGADEWNFLWRRYQDTVVASEKIIILESLGCTTNATLLAEYMESGLTPASGIRSQDLSSVYVPIYSNPLAFDALVDILRDWITDGGYGTGIITTILFGMSFTVTSQEQADQLIALGDLVGLQVGLAVQGYTESVLRWIQDNQEEIGQWLLAH